MLDFFDILQHNLIHNFILQTFAIANQHLRYLLSIIWITHSILLVQFFSTVSLMLHKLLFSNLDRIRFLRLFWKEGLCFLDCLFKWLKYLFVGVDQHFIIKLELEFIIRYGSEIKCQIPVIAAHSIQNIHHFQTIFSQFYNSECLLNLYLDWINNQMLLQNSIEE